MKSGTVKDAFKTSKGLPVDLPPTGRPAGRTTAAQRISDGEQRRQQLMAEWVQERELSGVSVQWEYFNLHQAPS